MGKYQIKTCIGKLFLVAALIVGLGSILTSRLMAQTLTTIYSFSGSDGFAPVAGLILSGNTLYGTTKGGGSLDNGTVFAINTNGMGFTNLYSFTATPNFTNSDGANPPCSLVLSGNTLYGMAQYGGIWGNGTAFALNTDGTGFRILHTFSQDFFGRINSQGAHPNAGLILSGNTLYGTTPEDISVADVAGTVFALSTDGTVFTVLTNTLVSGGGCLILSGNTLYGVIGGNPNSGAVFAVSTDGTDFTLLHNFTDTAGTLSTNSDGAYPNGSFILSGNTLYGTTLGGGITGNGTIFAINTDGSGFKSLYSFSGSDGDEPAGGLLLSGNTLYGTTAGGGSSGYGTVFKINTDGSGFINLYSFTGGSDGGFPPGGLLLSGNTLYGTTAGGGSSGAGTVFSLTLQPSFTIAPLRIPFSAANVSSTDSIDAPIIPFVDTSKLATATNGLGLGVVADGVTPVLFRISGSPGNYSLVLTNDATGYTNGNFSRNLFTLQNNSWVQTTNLTIISSGATGVTYAYLQGLEWNNFVVLSLSNEVNVGLSVMQTNLSQTLAQTTFTIRPPPIVLIHGYNADSNTWSSSFLNVLRTNAPAGFIQAVQYGVTYQTNIVQFAAPNGVFFQTNIIENTSGNTAGDLIPLAQTLDRILNQALAVWTNNWDFTRYDVVAHSQGGVLVRMLCQTNLNGGSAFASTPVVSTNNFNRGRFRRIITIGSPHNGSVLLTYILDMEHRFNPLARFISSVLGNIAQPKFDPFGFQIPTINYSAAYPIDSRIKFNCIQTTIGQPPSSSPLCYQALGLFGSLSQLLPNGADGVVDFTSQGGGFGTSDTYNANISIAHADYVKLGVPLFGVPAGQSDTTYPLVAQYVVSLLNGNSNMFGPFVLPTNLPLSQAMLINSIIPIISVQSLIIAGARTLDVSSNYNYSLQQPSGVPTGGTITWFVQVFGTNGVNQDGVSLQVGTNNSSLVTVSVDNTLRGTVVLYASYSTPNGTNLIFANPVVVLSNPVGTVLGGIELQPSSATLSVGDVLSTTIWGDYTNGARSELYLTNGEATYSSLNPNVATVDTNGIVTMIANGTAAISAACDGYYAQMTITPIGLPQITSQPTNQLLSAGSSATFVVAATGNSPLKYQWQKNSINLTDGNNVSGSTTTDLLISSVSSADAGNYSVIVSNSIGAVSSTGAVLQVTIVQNGDFESGDFTAWALSGDTSYTFVDDGSQSGISPHSGNYEAALGTSGLLGYLSQTLQTTAGASYLLSFWLNNYYNDPGEFRVSWNGKSLFDKTHPAIIGWTNIQFQVTATGTNTLLQFGFEDDHNYFGLDNISVAPVIELPPPRIASISLSGTSLILNGDNGLSGRTYYVLMSTNLGQPLSEWTPMATNVLSVSGNFNITVTNAVDLNASHRFYIIKSQ